MVGEEAIALSAQETVDRFLGQHLVTEPCDVVEQVTLIVGHTERHPHLRIKNYINVILPDLPAIREPLRQFTSEKNTSHLEKLSRQTIKMWH